MAEATEQSLQRAFARQQRAKIAAKDARRLAEEAEQELHDATEYLVAEFTACVGEGVVLGRKAGRRG